ncbi:alpha/beta hydrolase [Paenibacillus dakarensis]|uniref:alpha/beta hydrolase n=1 Tax=Paenibacillus dakarensis TaxID=1527293 RepID=UPI0006D53826|nr:alpha/beta hydrolase [Paenibacillus dakarensis]
MKLWEQEAPGIHSVQGAWDNAPGMTPYLLKGDKPRAAVLVLPGGGYSMRAEHEGEPVARWLNSIGLSAFVVHYRVAPYRHPYPLMDAQRAIRLVRFHAEEWGIDPERIGILGFSAGGHLAATVCNHAAAGTLGSEDPIDTCSSRPDAAVLCYPVISFREFSHEGSILNLLGDGHDIQLLDELSNHLRVSPGTPPTFLWHTADDSAVPVENSLEYAKALSRNKVPYELHVFPEGRHGLGLADGDPSVSQWSALCGKWFRQIGFV